MMLRVLGFLVFVVVTFPVFATDFSDGISAKEAKDLIVAALGPQGGHVDIPISAARIYPACDQSPTISPRGGSMAMVTLACDGTTKWSRVIRTGVPDIKTVRVTDAPAIGKNYVVVLTKSLAKGAVITKQDVELKPQPQNSVALAFADLDQVIGRIMDTHLGQGRVLQSRHLEKHWMVQPKQPVQIVYDLAGVSVIAPGISQDQGQKGEMIWVLNSASGRKVRGVIASQNKILVRAKIK